MAAVYAFGEFRLDCGRFALLRDGHQLPLERKPMELLILLAERQGQLVSRGEIGERLWDRTVFVDTEHGINTAIRKIRQALRDDSESPRYIQTVIGKGYRFAAPVLEERPAEAPPVELSAEAAVHTSGLAEPITDEPVWAPATNPEAPLRAALRRWRWPITAATVAGLLIVFGVRAWSHRGATANIHSLAVLPLNNVSGDATQDYLADGMTDELTTMLVRDSTLRVVSRTSAMQYKQAHLPLAQIARALNVDGVLEGSVARAGSQVHLNLQLIRADTDSHLWAQSYDRDANDVALPGEAAQAVAQRLHSEVPAPLAVRSVNPAAHDAYLRGKYLWFSEHMDESGAYFRKATEIQPDYAAAWAGLSCYYGEGVASSTLDPRTSMGPGEVAARRALQLDPNLAESHQAMAGMFLIDHWDGASADREVLLAIRLAPQEAEMYSLRANVLKMLHRFPEAIEYAKKAMELNPFERPYGLAETYLNAGEYDVALAELQQRLEATPNDPMLLFLTMDAWRRKGNYQEAVDAWARFHVAVGEPRAAAALRRAYEQGGARGFVRWQLARRLKEAKSTYVSPVELAGYHAQLGEREQTLQLLEEAYQQRATDLLWIDVDPAYQFLQGNSRYQTLLHHIGVPMTAPAGL